MNHLLGYTLTITLLALPALADNMRDPMNNKSKQSTSAPYGSWNSALTAESIFESSDSIDYLSAGSNALFFVESRASANGRSVLVKLDSKHQAHSISSPQISVRSRVHEYGGRPFLAVGDTIYYSDFSDQRIYQLSPGGEPKPLTPEGLRYMECIADEARQRLICVREDHRAEGEAVNTLVAVDMDSGGEGEVLFEGTDFVVQPTLSPDGQSLAFVTWSHPNMPWDDTQLRVAQLGTDGLPVRVEEVPQTGNVAIRAPQYLDDGTLYFIADWSNWWVLYRLNSEGSPELVLDQSLEMNSFAFESATSAIITYGREGQSYLARVDLNSGTMANIGTAFAAAGSLTTSGGRVYFVASTTRSDSAIYQLSGETVQRVYQPKGPQVADGYFSAPQPISYPTGENEQAHGFFYPPQNIDFVGPKGTLPPLIIKVHGGPVSSTSSALNPAIQFWTSRGFAVFDVNHRGSTGYGRSFRKKLYPNWGLVDIEDVANAAKWLAEEGYVDGEKLAIRGGSAGGYTVLAALAFQDVFKAGTSYFGISDLEILAQDTHKFESRYPDQLIGPYPAARDVYLKRSPIYAVDAIDAPLLLLQGLDDKVVPPNQSEMIFEALKKNCVPSAYISFEGEGHGFRQPANNIRALNAELDFYGQVFGFTPAGDIESVELIKCAQPL